MWSMHAIRSGVYSRMFRLSTVRWIKTRNLTILNCEAKMKTKRFAHNQVECSTAQSWPEPFLGKPTLSCAWLSSTRRVMRPRVSCSTLHGMDFHKYDIAFISSVWVFIPKTLLLLLKISSALWNICWPRCMSSLLIPKLGSNDSMNPLHKIDKMKLFKSSK